jgi:hypothetical protein
VNRLLHSAPHGRRAYTPEPPTAQLDNQWRIANTNEPFKRLCIEPSASLFDVILSYAAYLPGLSKSEQFTWCAQLNNASQFFSLMYIHSGITDDELRPYQAIMHRVNEIIRVFASGEDIAVFQDLYRESLQELLDEHGDTIESLLERQIYIAELSLVYPLNRKLILRFRCELQRESLPGHTMQYTARLYPVNSATRAAMVRLVELDIEIIKSKMYDATRDNLIHMEQYRPAPQKDMPLAPEALSSGESAQQESAATRLITSGIIFERVPETVHPGQLYTTPGALAKHGGIHYSHNQILRLADDDNTDSIDHFRIAGNIYITPKGVEQLLVRQQAREQGRGRGRKPGPAGSPRRLRQMA